MFEFSKKESECRFKGFNFKYILKERKYDNNHLIVVFSGFGAKSQFTYDFKNSLDDYRSAVLWIKDDFFENNNATYYLNPLSNHLDLESAIISFIEECLLYLNLQKENCTFLGCSKGGAAALYYGLKYDFKNILLSAPTLKVGSSIAGLIPKSKMKSCAKFILGGEVNDKNIMNFDNKIINILNDNTINKDKNIYLISSQSDPAFEGQIKSNLYLFYKFFNFNFIESSSVLVRNHQDVTRYNSPLILSILNILSFNLIPQFKNSIIQGDSENKLYKFNKESVFNLQRIFFNSKGYLDLNGVFFIRGIACKEYSDLTYSLWFINLKNNEEVIRLSLAKGNKANITKEYYKGKFVNYDKAFFCTKGYEGLDLSAIPLGQYFLKINIHMRSGESDCKVLTIKEKIFQKYSEGANHYLLESLEDGKVIFTKK